MPYKKNGETKIYEVFEVFIVGWICPGDLTKAKEEVKKIKENLQGDSPISGVSTKLNVSYHDDYNSYVFPVSYRYGGGEKIETDEFRGSKFCSVKDNPDDY